MYKKQVKVDNFFYVGLLIGGFIQGNWLVYIEDYFEALFVYRVPVVLFLANVFYSLLRKKTKNVINRPIC